MARLIVIPDDQLPFHKVSAQGVIHPLRACRYLSNSVPNHKSELTDSSLTSDDGCWWNVIAAPGQGLTILEEVVNPDVICSLWK
jgi:hypothetical protein